MLLQDNDYVSAIKSVATILSDYYSDQQFPAFGFGAKSPLFQGVSHCFPLNFNFSAPEVVGVQASCSVVNTKPVLLLVLMLHTGFVYRVYWTLTTIL